jgi:hypothetical protein
MTNTQKMLNSTNEKLEDLYKTGIYIIHCKNNNHFYIGSASSSSNISKNYKSRMGFYCRWRFHMGNLLNNNHRNKYLQYAFNKYGESSIQFYIVEFCNTDVILQREEYWINYFKENAKIFNHKLKPHSTKYRKIGIKHKAINKNKGKSRPLSLKKALGKPVLVFTLEHQFIEEVYSMTEAAKKYNTCRQDIRKCCLNLISQSKGYIFKYKS